MLPEIAYRSMQNGSDDDVEVSFMVPCLNEEANVVGTLETIMSALVRVGCSYEILVFDDGSQDNTAAVVTAFQAAHPQAPVQLFATSSIAGLRSTSSRRRFKAAAPIIAPCLATTSSRRNQSSRSSARVERQMSSFPISWRFETDRFGALSYPSSIRVSSTWRADIGWPTTTEIRCIGDLT